MGVKQRYAAALLAVVLLVQAGSVHAGELWRVPKNLKRLTQPTKAPRRVDRTPLELKATPKPAAKQSAGSVPWVFRFYGPTLDTDLTSFYAYFATSLPPALKPVSPPLDQVPCGSPDPTSAVCPTIGHVLLANDLLDRTVPADFDRKVLAPLRRVYGDEAIPGLALASWEGEATVTYEGSEPRKLCEFYRVDRDSDCVLEALGHGRYSIRTQGYQTSVELPSERADQLIAGYLRAVEQSPGWREKRIDFFPNLPLVVQSAGTPGSDGGPPADPPITSGVQAATGLAALPACPGVGHPSVPSSSLDAHLREYQRVACATCSTGAIAPGSYPAIVVFDQFADDVPAGPVPAAVLAHPVFGTSSDNVDCIDWRPSDSTHGVSTISTILGRGAGTPLGLLPDLPLDKLLAIQVKDLAELADWLPVAKEEYDKADGRIVIANVSLSLNGDSGGAARSTLLDLVRRAENKVLFVVAAGAPDTQANGWLLAPGCQTLPACLGDLQNVVVVAGLDRTAPAQVPRLWTRSNHGGHVVSMVAPAIDVVGADYVRSGDGRRVTLSVRSGTSEAAALATGVAARMVALNPSLTPREVKAEMIAAAGEYEATDATGAWRRELFAGPGGRISGGCLDGARATAFGANVDEVEWVNRPPVRGDLQPVPALKRLRIFGDRIGTKSLVFECPAQAVRRIVRRGTNQVAVFCDDFGTPTFIEDAYVRLSQSALSTHMPCLDDPQGCFVVKDASGNGTAIRLEEVKDVLIRR